MVRLALAVASLVIALAGLELFVRVAFPGTRDQVIPGRIFELDEELGWRLRPDRTTVHETQLFDATYTTNSQGFRDREHTAEPDAKKRRVLLFGDSQFFGWGVDSEDRASEQMEAMRPDLDVWNFGVPAYGLDQEILSYSRNAANLTADVVVFLVTAATLERSRMSIAYNKPKPRFSLEPDGMLQLHPPEVTGWRELLYDALSPLSLPYFLQQRWFAARQALSGEAPRNLADVRPDPLDSPLIELALAQATARGHHVVFLSTLLDDDHAHLFPADGSVPVVHVSDVLLDPFRIGNGDRHWTREGHRRIAEALLASEALTPRTSPP